MEGSLAGLTRQGQPRIGIASGSLTLRFPAQPKKNTRHGRSRRRTEPPFEFVTLFTFSRLSIPIPPREEPPISLLEIESEIDRPS